MKNVFVLAGLGLLAVASAKADDLMPSFANVPTNWAVDRYLPNSFSDVGTYQGLNDVLGIGITSAQDSANRGAQGATFYNTQGEGYAVSGGAGSSISALLFVDANWVSPANGYVRTDMWGVIDRGNDYPIIGFSNEPTTVGATPYVGFRVWDENIGSSTNNDWVNLTTTPVNYNAWNLFTIVFTGTQIQYDVNGTMVYSYAEPGATGFTSLIMEAYNFGDPALANSDSDASSVGAPGYDASLAENYTAHWANTPEPASVLSLATVFLALAGGFRRRFHKA
jgi:hypothetical protein